jgi:hypothetical protein
VCKLAHHFCLGKPDRHHGCGSPNVKFMRDLSVPGEENIESGAPVALFTIDVRLLDSGG